MTAVFLHGVPDTYRVWDPLLDVLATDEPVVTLALPGFDAPVPDGFDASKEAYVDWLLAEITAVGEPVHLVGHDWGSFFVQRLASIRPDLVRTWCAMSAFVDPEYVWHDAAQAWQTPELGEQVMELFQPEILPDAMTDSGLPRETLVEMASHIDDTMKACILPLYRSAIHLGEEWAPAIEAVKGQRPMFAIGGADDAYVPARFAASLAKRAGGQSSVVKNCGHWVPIQAADVVADILRDLWAWED